MSKYPIIVFEGIEASGKSTSLKKLIKYLKSNKIKYVTFREPGGTKNAEIITRTGVSKTSQIPRVYWTNQVMSILCLLKEH